MPATSDHDSALMADCPSGRTNGPPGHATSPPASDATMAMESVSSMAYVPPRDVTACSNNASMSRAAEVISDAMGGKQYSPGTSGCATRHENGVASMP